MGAISPKWIAQVFRQRGIPPIALETMNNSVGYLSDSERAKLLVAVSQIERGTEGAETLEWARKVLQAQPAPDSTRAVHLQEQKQVKVATRVKAVTAPKLHDSEPLTGRETPLRKKHHIYGKEGALTVELDLLKEKDHTGNRVPTILIEAAKATGPRAFNWEAKIPFQLMKRELPLLACVLLGYLDKALVLANHGPDANKALSVESQRGKLFIRVTSPGKIIAVPVDPSDSYAFLDLVMEALALSSGVDGATRLLMLKRVAEMLNEK